MSRNLKKNPVRDLYQVKHTINNKKCKYRMLVTEVIITKKEPLFIKTRNILRIEYVHKISRDFQTYKIRNYCMMPIPT